MKDLTDEMLERIINLIIHVEDEKPVDKPMFWLLSKEQEKRSELASLNFDDCESCKL